MKRYTIHTFSALALLLAATACTRDDAGTLPDGTQPLTLTAAIEGSADTRATVDNRWNGNETIALQVTDGDGTDWYDYMVDDKGNLSGDYFWTKPSSITVQGLYPNIMVESNDWTWGVKEDQSSDADYQSGDLLCSESKAVNFGQTPNLTFYHQTAKVVVNIKQEGLPTSIDATANNISLTIGEGLALDGTFTLPTAAGSDNRWLGTWTLGRTKGSIKPHLATTKPEGCFATYEALVIPQDVTAGTRLLTFTAEKDGKAYGPFYYTLKGDAKWQAGYVYTYDITIFHHGLEVQVSESIDWGNGATGSGNIFLQDYTISDDGTYTVYTAEGLDAWAEAANQDLSTNCILMTDIDLSGVDWEPVAFGDYNTYYTGTFDGNGHAISNLAITKDLISGAGCGMFGRLGANATIKNLTLENVSLNVSAYRYPFGDEIGALVGVNQGTISNCNVSGNISINSQMQRVGGIVGRMEYGGVIQYCHSSASIQGNSYYVGGVLGGEYMTATVIKGCSFSGSITSNGAIGGIAGYCRFFNDMIGCYSVGELSDLSTTAYRTGGVVGFLQINTTANACYWEGFDGEGVGYCNENNQWDGAYKVDGEAINWAQTTEAMNTALGTDAEYHWHIDDPNTPPTLVPNN